MWTLSCSAGISINIHSYEAIYLSIFSIYQYSHRFVVTLVHLCGASHPWCPPIYLSMWQSITSIYLPIYLCGGASHPWRPPNVHPAEFVWVLGLCQQWAHLHGKNWQKQREKFYLDAWQEAQQTNSPVQSKWNRLVLYTVSIASEKGYQFNTLFVFILHVQRYAAHRLYSSNDPFHIMSPSYVHAFCPHANCKRHAHLRLHSPCSAAAIHALQLLYFEEKQAAGKDTAVVCDVEEKWREKPTTTNNACNAQELHAEAYIWTEAGKTQKIRLMSK